MNFLKHLFPICLLAAMSLISCEKEEAPIVYNCGYGFTGPDCDEIVPGKLYYLSRIEVLQMPLNNNGTPWDVDSPPDVRMRYSNSSFCNLSDHMLSQGVNDVSNIPFSLPQFYMLGQKRNEMLRLCLYDVDVQTSELMAFIDFIPSSYQGNPTNLLIQNNDIALNIDLVWLE